jgi:alpha-beta hydrolase superfamily lysophospholipase
MRAGADDYLPITEYMVKQGLGVFSYDSTGTYDSEGRSTVGMCQSVIDLESAVKYISENELELDTPIFLLGHSWGAYAAASVLSLCPRVRACAAIAGMNNACDMPVDKAKEYVGTLAHLPEPTFSIYQRLLFDKYVDLDSVKGINHSGIPVVLAHGVEDRVVRYENQSILSHKAEITNPKVNYYVGKGLLGGHDSIWHSKDAESYRLEIESELKLMAIERGGITDKDKRELYSAVDHTRLSAPNEELMEMITSVFEKAIR